VFVYRVQRFVGMEGANSGAALPDAVSRNNASIHDSTDSSYILRRCVLDEQRTQALHALLLF
jgi:hypothetical protein